MNWAEQVVSEFGRRIGIPQLALDANGSVRLETADDAGLGIFMVSAESQPEVVVYRSFLSTYLTPDQYRAALQSANFRNPQPWPMQAAYDQKELIIAVRIPERSFMVSTLEKALEDLGFVIKKITQ
jgi:hypothetical protein